MQNLLYSNKSYLMPGSYNELTGKQLVKIAGLFLKDIPEAGFQLKAMRILLDKSLYSFFRIPVDTKHRILDFMEWLTERNKLTEQLLPFYKGFAGAKKEFDNLIMAEFHHTEMYYHDYVVEEDPAYLDKLIAVLYRPIAKGYDFKIDSRGDGRVAFNENEIAFHVKKIAKWRNDVKLAILFFYDGCRQKLLEDNEEVFKGDKGQDNDAGMFDIIRGISGPVYGTIENVEQLNVHTALLEITRQLREAKEIEKSMR